MFKNKRFLFTWVAFASFHIAVKTVGVGEHLILNVAESFSTISVVLAVGLSNAGVALRADEA